MKYNRELMMAILHDRVQIAKNVDATPIPLEDAPQGYAEFDKGGQEVRPRPARPDPGGPLRSGGERVTDAISEPALDYRWSAFPEDPERADGWAHHGVAVTTDGRVVTFAPSGDEVVISDADGQQLDRWSTGLTEGHCISLSRDDDGDHLWIADPRQQDGDRFAGQLSRLHSR